MGVFTFFKLYQWYQIVQLLTFSCSKPTIETIEKDVKYVRGQ